jgi:hypothetical protein
VSVNNPDTLMFLIESRLEMNNSDLKKDFPEFVACLKKMAIIHYEHCHVVEHKETGDSGIKNIGKSSDAGSHSSEQNSGVTHMEMSPICRLTVTERSPDMEGRRTRLALESSQLESRRLASKQNSVRARSTICPTVLTLESTKLLSCCLSTRRRYMPTKRRHFKSLGNNGATADNRDGQAAILKAENLGVKVTVFADTGSDYSDIPLSAVEDARKRGFPLKVEVLPEPIMMNMAIRGESDKQKCSATEMLMSAVTITTPSGPLSMRECEKSLSK